MMEYFIAPDGMICGVNDTVLQEQIDEIIEGNYFSKEGMGHLFSDVASSLQKSVKKSVPSGWKN